MQKLLLGFIFTILPDISKQNTEEFCSKRIHYNDPSFTCCANKLYAAPNLYTRADSPELKACLEEDNIKGITKLVPKAWKIYECLVKKQVKDVTIDSFTTFMIARFKEDQVLTSEIEKNLKEIKGIVATREGKSRRKRVADAGENNSTIPVPVDQKENDTSSTSAPETQAPKPPDNQESAPESTENPKDKEGAVTPYSFPIYEALSAYQYYSDFKKAIPNENIFKVWDMYYSAEFQACQKLGGTDENEIKSFGSRRCFGWIMSSARRGGCCENAPIPIPLLGSGSMDNHETIRNHTAGILNMTGHYIATNLSRSVNIYRCTQFSKAILQGSTTLTDFDKKMQEYIKSNGTKRVDYTDIARTLIPNFFPESLRKQMATEMLPPTTTTSRTGDKQDAFFVSLEYDGDLKRISNFTSSAYEWAGTWEWDTLDVNRTRYLMWTCDAYRIISQRILLFNTGPACY